MLCEGQQQAEALGYSPLPLNLVQAGFKQIARIPGAGNAANVDFNKCNNPTFKPGDKPGDNLLAKTAPQPQECDKQGATQCETGSSSTGGGSAGSGGTGTDSGSGTGTDDGTQTDNGSGSGTGSNVYVGPTGNGKAQLEAYAYDLPKAGWGINQTWMLVAGLFAILVVIAPPIAIRWMQKRKGGGE
jgi:hypothetical protein